ncbi:MAG: diguanylate cyclase, partial [Polyangiaceae bacterium]|nr:diguanylate cyclase [Polyangiaceae bacterium]
MGSSSDRKTIPASALPVDKIPSAFDDEADRASEETRQSVAVLPYSAPRSIALDADRPTPIEAIPAVSVRKIPADRPTEPLPQLYEGDSELSRTDQTAVMEPISVRKNERASLTLIAGTGAGRIFPLNDKVVIIGRSSDADIQLSDLGISRQHSRISRGEHGNYLLEDLGSTNGTLLNGARIARAELRPGDRAQLGPGVVFQFVYMDEAEDQLARSLYESSTRDGLTGAFNRKYLEDHLTSEVSYASRHRAPLSFLLFDLDHFKKVNDTFGHPGGDALLRAVAEMVRNMTRPEDIFTRYGGEEFALLARGVKLADGARFGERLRKAIEAMSVAFEGRAIKATISIGVAEMIECPLAGERLATPHNIGDALRSLADKRLYLAKSAGRNRVV